MIVYSRRIVTEDGIIDGYLRFENGVISDIVRKEVEELVADIDAAEDIVIPGIFDTHNHGFRGWNPSDSVESIKGYAKALPSAAVTAIFPTVSEIESYQNVSKVMKENNYSGARIMGIHSEGPYLNRVGEKGVDNGHPEITMEDIEMRYKAAEGNLRLFALAPELEHSQEAVRYLTKHGVRCAFAHSNQTYEEAMASFKNGITVVTHTANVMSGLHHREMGGLGAAILNDGVYNELICDGMHVRNEMIEIIMRVKKDAFHKVMMISDNSHFAGLPAGRYSNGFFGETNITKEGFCLTDTGRLAGSAKPVLYGMRNLVKNLHYPLEKVSEMASLNPCLVYGFADKKGSLRIGKDADFAIIDDDFNCLMTYREGEKVFDAEERADLSCWETVEKYRIG